MLEIFEYNGFVLDMELSKIMSFYRGKCEKLGFDSIGYYPKSSLIDMFKIAVDLVAKEDEKEQVQYGQEVLAQDLFNSMLRHYPEALPEVIELLDTLHNQYKGRIK
jgi:hypothetical protein